MIADRAAKTTTEALAVDSFGRALAFAVVAALGWLPWALFCGGVLGLAIARVLYLVVVAAAYVGTLGSPPRIGRALAVAVLGMAAALLADTVAELAIALAALVGLCRVSTAGRTPGLRAVAVEVVLLASGLVFARYLALSGLPSTAVAIWGFLLVQSAYFLGALPRASSPAQDGGFDDLYRRATELLNQHS